MDIDYKNIGSELNLGKLLNIELIQKLWSGYGKLLRLEFESGTIIVKHVKIRESKKHPKGFNSDFAHQRKIDSYKVEVNWYENFSKEIDDSCRMPYVLKSFKKDDEWLIVMQDLATIGLKYTTQTPRENHIKSALLWLANFHAKYMNKKSEYIWKIGTYWHLDTRPEEFDLLEDKELKNRAKEIDKVLNSSKYQTVVHGDAKLANFCFNSDGSKCAAVDFQYVGHGSGVKDLIYFISSCLQESEYAKEEGWILEFYFDSLQKALHRYQPEIDFHKVKKEYKDMYSFAWADFYRFLKGWSPNHYKINSYSKRLTQEALKVLE